MAIDTKGFTEYVNANKSKLDTAKLKGLSKQEQQNVYNEWKQTGSLPKSYMKQTPAQSVVTKSIAPIPNKVEPTPTNMPPIYTSPKIESNITKTNTTYNGGKFGDTASGNIMDEKLKETGKAFENQQKQSATDLVNAYKAGGKEESDLTKQRDEAAKQRYASQQSQLDKNKADAEARIEKNKQAADELLKRQEGIAARQSNIAAAQAGESGLQMSAAAVSDITNDIIAKYGSNLATAEQFRNQTNMTLDDALTKVAGDTFKDKQSIDLFLNKLDEAEYQPLLNAVQKATEGNVQAVKDVKDFYNKITQTKADEEYRRFSEDERYADNERNWATADTGKRLSLLQAELKQLGITDPFIANPEKFANMSFAEALNTVAKDANNKVLMDQAIQTAIDKGTLKTLPKIFQDYAQNMGAAGLGSQDRLDATAEQKVDKVKPSEQMIKTTSDINKNNFGLSDSNIKSLDTNLASKGKDKVIQGLQTLLSQGKINKSIYDNSIRYINSK